MNTFGTLFRLTDFGESHGAAIGGVVDGMPAGIEIDFDAIDTELARRRPGSGSGKSARCEADNVQFLSGIFEGRTLGTPIAFIIENTDARSSDYADLEHKFRPNHADFTYFAKYGHRDYRGGGRASARETAVRVVAGALAKQVLAKHGISVHAYPSQIGSVAITDAASLERADAAMRAAKADKDTLGGIVSCVIEGLPAGVGEPVFGKLQAMLASAMMSINAAKGFEYGDGFAAASLRGSESIDEFYYDGTRVRTRENHSGGIQGGISNGEAINFRVAFKPIATLPRRLATLTDTLEPTEIEIGGRHDVCVVPRAVPVVEAMAAITVLDALMIRNASLSVQNGISDKN